MKQFVPSLELRYIEVTLYKFQYEILLTLIPGPAADEGPPPPRSPQQSERDPQLDHQSEEDQGDLPHAQHV